MNGSFALLNSLTIQHWLTIGAIFVAIIGVSFTAANYLAGRRERKLKTYEATPEVKATINRRGYEVGWRSVQLHIIAAPEQQNFKYENWYIERASLLRPWWDAVLARAENDDYATGVFYPDNPVRSLVGKAQGRPQRFALEFFIKFKAQDDRGRRAKFKVVFSHANKRRRHTVKVWTAVPEDAELRQRAR
jgi:hypothetical protein